MVLFTIIHLCTKIFKFAFSFQCVLHSLAIVSSLTFRHRASCMLGQAFHYSPENAFYIYNQHIYFIIDICLTVHH